MRHFFKRCLELFTPITAPPEPLPPVKEKNEVEVLMDSWVNFDASKANKVFSSNKSILKVGVRKRYVEEYLNYLDMILFNVKNNTIVIPSMTQLTTEVVYLRDFFISKHGYFLDAEEKVIQLREKVITFLTFYNEATTNVDETEEHKRTAFYTSSLIGELRHLLEVLEL